MRTLLVLTILIFQLGAFAAVESASEQSFSQNIKIAKDTARPMSQRWKALIAASEKARFEQLDEIKGFIQSKDWYMRNAALVALKKINTGHAIEEAKVLLKDKALVVRSAAVDVISSNLTRENRDILAAELDKSYNFSKKQSLWIRSKIFGIISSRAQADDRAFFSRYVFDKDPKIAQMAISTLEKITDVQFSGSKKLAQWKEHIKKNNW